MNRLSTNDDQFNALLGAYLDNEVTAEERQQVDRALNDPAARTMLADIRQLKSDVAALPRLHLEPGFYQHVLRQAEREMVRGEDPPTILLDTAGPRSPDRRRNWFLGTFSTWPRVAAALLVLAPALALIVLATRPGDKGERHTLAERQQPGKPVDVEEDRSDGRKEELSENEGAFGGARSRVRAGAGQFNGGGGGPAPGAPAPPKQTLKRFHAESLTTAPADPGMLVVHVAVTPEGWQSGEVRKLLAGNKSLNYQELGDKNDGDAPLPAPADGKARPRAGGLPRPVRVVNLEAPTSELQALLAKLQAQAKTRRTVLALHVQPPPNAQTHDRWSAYNHGAGFFQMDPKRRISRALGLEGKPGDDEDNKDKQSLSRKKNAALKKGTPAEEPSPKKRSRTKASQRTNDKPSTIQKSEKKGIPQARALIIFYIQPAVATSPRGKPSPAKKGP